MNNNQRSPRLLSTLRHVLVAYLKNERMGFQLAIRQALKFDEESIEIHFEQAQEPLSGLIVGDRVTIIPGDTENFGWLTNEALYVYIASFATVKVTLFGVTITDTFCILAWRGDLPHEGGDNLRGWDIAMKKLDPQNTIGKSARILLFATETLRPFSPGAEVK